MMSSTALPLDIVIVGLSITSAWGNGHATTYRALARGLHERGHRVRFFERDRPWYAANRDLPHVPWCRTTLYRSFEELDVVLGDAVDADLVMIGSYVPEGARIAERLLERATGATAFYDIDTPVTVAALERGQCDYLTPALVHGFDLYLSFAGGPVLERLQRVHGARRAVPFYCSVDEHAYFPMAVPHKWDLAYLGTYSIDRQPRLEQLLNEPARAWPDGRFCVAGPQYPETLEWPANVARIEHLGPPEHRRFYNSQRFALNVTRSDMVANGYSPSVRLFEAAACGVPIVSDEWRGLDEFFVPGREILVARSAADVLGCLRDLDETEAREIGRRARERVLAEHTAGKRAMQLEALVQGSRANTLETVDAG